MLLRVDAFGNVNDRGQDVAATVLANRVEANLHGKFAAVLAPPAKVAPDAHRSRFGWIRQ